MRAAFLSLLLALPAAAQPGHAYVTELGRRVLDKSDQIVEAHVVKVLPPFRGVSVARLEVTDRLQGYDRGKTLVLLYIEDYVAPDAFTATLDQSTVRYEKERRAGIEKYLKDLAGLKLPKAEERISGGREVQAGREQAAAPRRGSTGIRLAEGEDGIFFLKRQETSYSLVGMMPRRDALYDTKLARLKDVLALESIAVLDTRAANAKQLFLDGLGSGDVWLRANSARELASLASRYPRLFEKADAELLSRCLIAEGEPAIRASLERAAGAVDPDLAATYARQAEERGRTEHARSLEEEKRLLDATKLADLRAADLMRVARTYGRGATQLVASYLADRDAIVREYAAHALAEHGGPSANEALTQALGRERDTDAAMAMIYALGVHADARALDVLAPRLKEPALERAAVQALARLGTPEARRVLETHSKTASSETQDLIASLLKEEFSEQR